MGSPRVFRLPESVLAFYGGFLRLWGGPLGFLGGSLGLSESFLGIAEGALAFPEAFVGRLEGDIGLPEGILRLPEGTSGLPEAPLRIPGGCLGQHRQPAIEAFGEPATLHAKAGHPASQLAIWSAGKLAGRRLTVHDAIFLGRGHQPRFLETMEKPLMLLSTDPEPATCRMMKRIAVALVYPYISHPSGSNDPA